MVDASGAEEIILSGYRQLLARYRLDVTGDPAALRAAAASHRSQADQVRAGADAIGALARALGTNWEAPEYTTFRNRATDFSANIVIGTEQVLRQTADRLTSAANLLTDARAKVDAEITKFEAQARVLVTAARSVPRNQLQGLLNQARTLGLDACRVVQQIVLKLSTDLGATFGSTNRFRLPDGDITRLFHVAGRAPANAQWPPPPWDFFGSRRLTQAELNLLNQLTPMQRLTVAQITLEAEALALRHYPERVPHESVHRPRRVSPDGGHANAFKHTYWSARLAQAIGPAWAEAFTTAHETVQGTRQPGEGMDLFNNAVGRQLAAENPDADAATMVTRVMEAVAQGRTAVIDLDGNIRYSDRVLRGQTSH